MTFSGAIGNCFRHYADFRGRASRSEFWYWALFSMAVSAAISIMDFLVAGGQYPSFASQPDLITLFLLVPGLAVNVRRLHDLDKSGWWYFVILIPLIGLVILLVWDATRGTTGTNRFGPEPV